LDWSVLLLMIPLGREYRLEKEDLISSVVALDLQATTLLRFDLDIQSNIMVYV
jgi:hypothetical protein